jgi:uncharacterized protein YyaL (SSP411 family)
MNKPKFANRLAKESSPYLLQHAYNPVDWFAWGEEAFEKAEREEKPILLSIGYSACHWCHVMEHESFEDEATAKLMNENFVNIKVDLEERPDLDKIYMTFVQMTSGHGGYPLNVFLTPERKPFFGGTYFPPERRFNMPSWSQILTSIAEAYRERRNEVVNSANEILGEIRRVGMMEFSPIAVSLEQLDSAFLSFTKSFDSTNGGFGGAPKFPPPMSLEFLLRYYFRTRDESALEMVLKTCTEMANGGIYDQLGGGFHRYTVDAIWLVPHFEKMLYDNAQLARVYLHVWQITKIDLFRRIAQETLEYVAREMLDEEGGFYTAQDADSEGIEGKFFVWTPEEIESVIGKDEAEIFYAHYGVSKEGNFEEKNILNVRGSIEDVARKFSIPSDRISSILSAAREKLFALREKRIKPFRDEKVLTAWNGLMLAAFSEAAAILERDDFLAVAKCNAEFLLSRLMRDGKLLRSWKDGVAKLNAYLEDYANLSDGLVELFQASGEMRWLNEARNLVDKMIAEFWDEDSGGFFFTGKDHEELVVRSKDFYDNATPAGNSVAADVLLKLSKITGEEKYERIAVTILKLVAPQIRRFPQAFGRVLSTLEFHLNPTKEIVVIGELANDLTREIHAEYLPNKVLIRALNPSDDLPLLQNRTAVDGKPTAYVCQNFVCQKPATSVEELRNQLQLKSAAAK